MRRPRRLVDGGYSGEPFAEAVKDKLDATVQVAKRSELHTFTVMPRRITTYPSTTDSWVAPWHGRGYPVRSRSGPPILFDNLWLSEVSLKPTPTPAMRRRPRTTEFE